MINYKFIYNIGNGNVYLFIGFSNNRETLWIVIEQDRRTMLYLNMVVNFFKKIEQIVIRIVQKMNKNLF